MSLMAANDLELYVVDGQAGKMDDHTVDVSQVAPGGTVTLGVRINNYDFTLAGMEIEARFARYVYAMETDEQVWAGSNRPIKPDAAGWRDGNTQQLPANAQGATTNATVNNGFGTVRFGILALEPELRPEGDGTTNVNIGTIEIIVNNESDANCISGSEFISLFQCSNAGGACDIFANGSAERVPMNATENDLRVNLIRPGVPTRGDVNNSGALDTADIVGIISCVNGLSCNVDNGDKPVILDINCSGGNGDTGDVIPAISIANRITSFRGKRDLGSYALPSGNNVITVDNADRAGALMSLEFAAADNNINFGAVKFEAKGWYVDTYFSERDSIFKVTAVNLAGGNASFPQIQIPVSVTSRTGLTLIQSEYRNADNNLMDFVPAIAAGDISRDGLRDSGNGRTRN